MPGREFSKKVTTPKLGRQWNHVYKSAKSRGASPGSAIRQANAAVRTSSQKKGK